jgi:hypothetical protein
VIDIYTEKIKKAISQTNQTQIGKALLSARVFEMTLDEKDIDLGGNPMKSLLLSFLFLLGTVQMNPAHGQEDFRSA